MNFTYIIIIFNLFDIEIIILIPIIINQKINNYNINITFIFLLFIFFSTIFEIKNNKIK